MNVAQTAFPWQFVLLPESRGDAATASRSLYRSFIKKMLTPKEIHVRYRGHGNGRSLHSLPHCLRV